MGYRFYNSRKFMPAGLVTILRWTTLMYSVHGQTFVCLFVCLFLAWQPPMGQGFLIHKVSRSSRSRTTVSRTLVDEWSACHRDLYLTTHNIHIRQTSIRPVGFELTIPAGEWPQSCALDRMATGIDHGQTLTFYNSITIRLKLPDFWLQYFAHSLVSTNPSQGIYRGIEATLLVP
jgi:hypothetical protein